MNTDPFSGKYWTCPECPWQEKPAVFMRTHCPRCKEDAQRFVDVRLNDLPDDDNSKCIRWAADRFVHQHGDSPNVDYVLTLRGAANAYDTLLARLQLAEEACYESSQNPFLGVSKTREYFRRYPRKS